MTALLPRARRASRVLVTVAALSGPLLRGRRGGRSTQQALTLAALALGMPHGAADTELLRAASAGRVGRHAALLTAYAAVAAAATAVVRRGGPRVERAVLIGSAVHFAEGELACWAPGRGGPLRTGLRLLAAANATLALPAAIGRVQQVRGGTGAAAAPVPGLSPATAGDRSGGELLRSGNRPVQVLTGVAAATSVGLWVTGERAPAADTALLTALALLAPPATAFAGYFGGWHALRHTARVVDALTATGALPTQRSLPGAVLVLGRRSAWAALVGLAGAAVLAARDPEHASENAFAAVLGLTVPHMTTVALELAVRGGR